MSIIGGNIIDIIKREIYPGEIVISRGRIKEIRRTSQLYNNYIAPGFIDAHVHIESSMLTPCEFSKAVIARGTVAIINDPHEIANVLGTEGIRYMLSNSREAGIKMFFGIPSCVPATPFDSAGSIVSVSDIEELAKTDKFVLLSEMMNVPGVVNGDKEVLDKLNIAKRHHLKIDGHAPFLRGDALSSYIDSGITTDHEVTTEDEGLEKISKGMKVIIREGSAAKNYNALKGLIKTHPKEVMFCTDDSHPDDILESGHIDKIVKRALKDGFDIFDVWRAASYNPIKHYNIPVGILQKGDNADFVIFENLDTLDVLSVYIDGIEKYKKGVLSMQSTNSRTLSNGNPTLQTMNNFNHDYLDGKELKYTVTAPLSVIEVKNGELITTKKEIFYQGRIENLESDLGNDILKLVYINRYQNGQPQVAFVTGFGLKTGAFATTVAHDSHNIIAIGTNDNDLLQCINEIIANKGGMAVTIEGKTEILPLPIAGIMTNKSVEEVARLYKELNNRLKSSGCLLDSPFMTLSFMSLIVIPEVKIGEKGLFDYKTFSFIGE